MPTLKLSRNGAVLQELSLDRPHLLIGRSDDNDISIPSNYASRHHILLVRHTGSTILIDLNSTNGTFVNSKRVYNHVCVLTDGDVIQVDLHHKFVQYCIRYNETRMSRAEALGGIDTENAVIEKALADIGSLLENDDTDLIPAQSEDMPTEMGFLDDR